MNGLFVCSPCHWASLAAFFNAEFWQQVITTTLGVILGIPAAFWIEHWIGSERKKSEREELVRALAGTLEGNLGLVRTLIKDIASGGLYYTPLYPVDLTELDGTVAERSDLLEGAAAIDVDNGRYQLLQLNGTLKLLREAAVSAAGGNTQVQQFFTAVKGSISLHLPIVQQSIERAIDSLK